MAPCFQGGNKILRALKWYKDLLDNKKRSVEGYFLVEGNNSVNQILSVNKSAIEELLVVESQAPEYEKYSIPMRILSDVQLSSVCSCRTPQGIVALVKIPPKVYTSDLPENIQGNVLVLEHVQDPGNVGTLIRTAAALSFNGVIMTNQCADPFSTKVAQASAGSLFSLWLRRTDRYLSLIDQLKEKQYSVLTADLHGDPHVDFSKYENQILVLGNEGAGVTAAMIEKTDVRFSIPMNSSRVESMNVAISGGIVMFASMMKFKW
jgi:TrmH family RNA methyltransferase